MRFACACAAALFIAQPAHANTVLTFQPGTFSIDGIPARCGNVPIILDTRISDVGMSGYGLIYLNPDYLSGLETGLRLWWLSHECAHFTVGASELAADCWAVRKGRDEGWFPPEMFHSMSLMFARNPGDRDHPPGPDRVAHMRACYRS